MPTPPDAAEPVEPDAAWAATAERLTFELRRQLQQVNVEVAAELASTNTALLDRARTGHLQPCLLVAQRQSGGRGREGRPWWSLAGATLTFSLGLPLAPTDWSGLSLAAGLAVCEALRPWLGEGLGIKWPNDLWLRDEPLGDAMGRKLGGILIETAAAPGQLNPAARWAVIGVGLNVRSVPDAHDSQRYSSGFACIQQRMPAATLPRVLEVVAPALLEAMLQFERSGFGPLQSRFCRLDMLAGRRVRVGNDTGVAAGVGSAGQLLVQMEAGLRSVVSGEVKVQPC